MTATQFIIDNIKKMIKVFPTIRVRYAHDELSDIHSIEVVPNYIYHKDKYFNDWQRDTLLEFMDHYHSESLCYVTDNSIVRIEQYDFEVYGSHFYNVPTTAVLSETNCKPIDSTVFSDLSKDLFKNFKPDYISTLHTNALEDISKNTHKGVSEPMVFSPSRNHRSALSNASHEAAGENNYALAA